MYIYITFSGLKCQIDILGFSLVTESMTFENREQFCKVQNTLERGLYMLQLLQLF